MSSSGLFAGGGEILRQAFSCCPSVAGVDEVNERRGGPTLRRGDRRRLPRGRPARPDEDARSSPIHCAASPASTRGGSPRGRRARPACSTYDQARELVLAIEVPYLGGRPGGGRGGGVRIEEAIQGIDGIKRIQTTASEGGWAR